MQRLVLFIVALISGLAAGTVGALLMINAWYPTGLTSTTEYAAPRSFSRPVLDSNIIRDWRPRLIAVYDENKAINKTYFSESARITTAVVVNAGGWSVAPWSSAITKTNLIGTDYQGQKLTVERLIPDPDHGLVYIKFAGSNFRSTTIFADRSALAAGRLVWAGNSNWHLYTVDEPIIPARILNTVAVDKTVYLLREFSQPNEVLITDRGEFLGFTGAEQKIIPVWMVNQTITELSDSAKTASQWSFDWSGSFVERALTDQGFSDVSGFLVTAVRATKNHPVVAGNIIVKIDNQTVTQENLVELLTLAPRTFTATVMSTLPADKGSTRDILIQK